VKVLDAVGPVRLATRLERAGVPLALPKSERPGLAIALGGTGVTLAELARIYATIARGGKPLEPSYRRDAPLSLQQTTARPLLSPVASWYVADILSATPPPANGGAARIAFKTGTSYGYRDAWAVGFDGRHTVAVWAGRPDGASSPGLSGIASAAPVLYDAFSRLGSPLEPLAGPPRDAVIATTAELPPPLRYFGAETADSVTPSGAAPKIAFPPNGAEVAVAAGVTDPAALAFKAEGGRLPLTWFANGLPIRAAARRRTAFWRPDGAGFVRLTVMDGAGRTDSVTFKIADTQGE
jgi:penicillin-binding protein 1C